MRIKSVCSTLRTCPKKNRTKKEIKEVQCNPCERLGFHMWESRTHNQNKTISSLTKNIEHVEQKITI